MEHNKSTRLTMLKQKLNHIESLTTPMSPCASPRVPAISPPFSKDDQNIGGGGVTHLDVSGFAPLDDTIYEANSIHQRQPPTPLPVN